MTWRERIVAARERGRFTEKDRQDALLWSSCAVGEQHDKMPEVVRYINPKDLINPMDLTTAFPMDDRLRELGDYCGFAWFVRHGDIDTAEFLLDQIEDRVLELKREMDEHVEPI